MGLCVSSPAGSRPTGALTCQHCQQRSQSPMHLMTAGELRFWHMERNYVSCRKCHVQHQAQERLRNKERTFLKRLQQDLFPRMKRKNSLKKIASGQQWDGTSSFMEHYRPSRRVQDLERQLAEMEESEHVIHVAERPPSGIAGHKRTLASVQEQR